jgi:exosortase E/protease (VPEID-CTERM system)
MSSQSAVPSPVSIAPAVPWIRWLVLIALLIGEVLLLTLRFDTGALHGQAGWWALLLGESNLLLRLVIAIAAATLLLGGASLWKTVRRLSVPPLSPRRNGLPFLGHLTAFAAFAAVTAFLLESNADARSKAAATLLWCVLALATAGLWALTVLPAGLWLQLLGRHRLVLAAGCAVGTLAWAAGLLLRLSWRPLAEGTLAIVHFLLRLAYADAICQPAELAIGTSRFGVRIAPECSGYEGMGLLSVFVLAYLWVFRRELRFPQALLLWPAGVVILWLSNAVRIAVLIAIGTAGWPEVALGGFHSQAGWLAFNAVALGLAFVARRMRFFAIQPLLATRSVGDARSHAERGNEDHPVTAYLAPFLAILLTTMLTGAFTTGFDVLYPLRVVVAGLVLWGCRRDYGELSWSWSWQPFAVGLGVFVLWIALVPSGIGEPSALCEGLANLSPTGAATWLIFRIAGATLTVPLAEELAFRGYLARRLQAADWSELPPGRFTWLSLLASSLVFGVLHGAWLAGTLAGLAYAFAVWRRGRLMDAVLAHAATNALLAFYVLMTGAWALW